MEDRTGSEHPRGLLVDFFEKLGQGSSPLLWLRRFKVHVDLVW